MMHQLDEVITVTEEDAGFITRILPEEEFLLVYLLRGCTFAA